MMPSVAELTYFHEITKTLNLTQAAKNLCISQPALTRSLKNLERSVGAELFIRQKKGMVLTRAGKKILLQIKPLFECWKNAKLEAILSHQKVEGLVRIGCHSSVGLFIHGFVMKLLNEYPDIDIEVFTSISSNITNEVINLNIDIGIVSNPIQYPDLIIKKINETETSLWTGKGNSKIQDVHSGEAVLICNPEFHHTQPIMQKCKNENFKFKRLIKVNSIEVIASMTANGCGVGILPTYFVKYLYADKIRRVNKAPFLLDQLFLVYRKEYINVKVINTVIAVIRDWVKSA